MTIGIRSVVQVAAVLMAGIACGQGVKPDTPGMADDLAAKIAFGLRWIAYWEPDYIIDYKAGETIPIKLVQSPDELVVFLSKIRLSMTFRRSSDGKLDRLGFVGGLSRVGNETLDSDVQFYIQSHSTNGRPGFRLKPGSQSGTTGFAVPNERVTVGNPLTPASFRVSDVSLRLPDLALPKYVSQRISPPAATVDSLRAAVTKAVQSHMAANSKPATVVIPYFSPEDPAINVFVDFHEVDFSEGIFWVRPDALEGWSVDKLFLNRGPEHLDAIIAKIRALKLVEFSVPPMR
jgi:hypothetical protein